MMHLVWNTCGAGAHTGGGWQAGPTAAATAVTARAAAKRRRRLLPCWFGSPGSRARCSTTAVDTKACSAASARNRMAGSSPTGGRRRRGAAAHHVKLVAARRGQQRRQHEQQGCCGSEGAALHSCCLLSLNSAVLLGRRPGSPVNKPGVQMCCLAGSRALDVPRGVRSSGAGAVPLRSGLQRCWAIRVMHDSGDGAARSPRQCALWAAFAAATEAGHPSPRQPRQPHCHLHCHHLAQRRAAPRRSLPVPLPARLVAAPGALCTLHELHRRPAG